MRLALSLARRGLGQSWPNPSVGAVVASGDGLRIDAAAGTARGGRPHAEAIALGQAGAAARGATLYVTMEPCAHHGQTPPCADAIAAAGVARLVYGVVDPDPRVSGKGLARLARSGVVVEEAPPALAGEARWLAMGHILRITQRRPFVQLKLAVGADGLVPAGNGAPVWVTCEASRAYAHLLRAQTDAIAVGQGTMRADDPQLTCRLPGLFGRSPVRVVFSSRCDVSPGARLFADAAAVPAWIVTGEAAAADRRADSLRRAGARIIAAPVGARGQIEIAPALSALAEAGLTRLFVEGGPGLARAFMEAGCVDEAFIFHAARKAGEGGLKPFCDQGLERLERDPAFRLTDERQFDCDLVKTYRRAALV